MRLSFSNIAWTQDEEEEIASLLADAGVRLVDIAPGKYFADPAAASAADAERVRLWWADRGFAIAGMQALLFGVSGLNLFTDDGAMLARLSQLCRLGAELGAGALTFGSPRQRDRTGVDDATAERIAVDFFRRLGDAAAGAGVLVCLEPNPAIYGCNFMVRTDEAAAIVRAVDHPAIRLQLDVGAIAANGEDATRTIEDHCALIGHVHASEPGLVVLGDGGAPHVEAGAALRALRAQSIVTVEMAAPPNEPHARAVARALEVAKAAYGDLPRGGTGG
jgi:D-psicose/D-tagatose/L-ribulose 3-epimerase